MEGFLLQAALHALNHNIPSMKECLEKIKSNGGYSEIIPFKITSYLYNGLFHKTLNELKLLQSDIPNLTVISSKNYIKFLTEIGMNKTLTLFLNQLEKLNIKVDNLVQPMDNLKLVLEHFDEDIYSPVLAEAYTYLFQNKVGLKSFEYEFDEEQQAIFIELFVTFYNKNGDEIELSEKNS